MLTLGTSQNTFQHRTHKEKTSSFLQGNLYNITPSTRSIHILSLLPRMQVTAKRKGLFTLTDCEGETDVCLQYYSDIIKWVRPTHLKLGKGENTSYSQKLSINGPSRFIHTV